MTDSDMDDVIAKLAGLWPKQVSQMTSEQATLWRKSLIGQHREVAMNALNRHCQNNRFAPRLSEILTICRAADPSPGLPGTAPVISPVAAERSRLKNKMPNREQELRDMTDAEIEVEQLRWNANRAAEVYGEKSLSTAHLRNQFQLKLAKLDSK